MGDLSGDRQKLQRLAQSSGGEMLSLEQLADLPDKLLGAGDHGAWPIEYRLWDSAYLFLFVLGCLGAEWALRKRFGLA